MTGLTNKRTVVQAKPAEAIQLYDEDEDAVEEVVKEEDDTDEDDPNSGNSEDESNHSDASYESQDAQDATTMGEIDELLDSFTKLKERYRFITKIGEGTFSTVYKAEDLYYDEYVNDWDIENRDSRRINSLTSKQNSSRSRAPKFVAIKKIYVTSSPARIQNELELLNNLRGSDNVVALITAFRHYDQVVAVMPYFKHIDFRDYFRKLNWVQIRLYFRQLFSGLAHVHSQHIIHRDIKPTNFLFDVAKGRGVLVDFGLAEREDKDGKCMCQSVTTHGRTPRLPSHLAALTGAYPKAETRPARRANRAGTRGFRAPEVLFKCAAQTTQIDIWSAGVILLTFMSKRFPFFNSSDDTDALIEIATMFGKLKTRNCAALHGSTFECTIPTIGENGFSMQKIILWATSREEAELDPEETQAINFLTRIMELDPSKRLTAAEAMEHEFVTGDYDGDEEVDAVP